MKKYNTFGFCLYYYFLTGNHVRAINNPRRMTSTSCFIFPQLSQSSIDVTRAISSRNFRSSVEKEVAKNTLNHSFNNQSRRTIGSSTTPTSLAAAPKRGSIVDTYQTVSVNCSKCRTRLFRYKKKNGTKSNLVKCYVERICEDSAGLLEQQQQFEEENSNNGDDFEWTCPNCDTKFARSTMIRGLPALKLVGGKVRMTKK
mmetsp:Transcript_23883/g.33399  ORF Transcript_23883/g.33399 Transcript_23883/m.33399 type:complete len:200 (-) Transcript_23883:1420-2019(-)